MRLRSRRSFTDNDCRVAGEGSYPARINESSKKLGKQELDSLISELSTSTDDANEKRKGLLHTSIDAGLTTSKRETAN